MIKFLIVILLAAPDGSGLRRVESTAPVSLTDCQRVISGHFGDGEIGGWKVIGGMCVPTEEVPS